jgi:hypothetical protein
MAVRKRLAALDPDPPKETELNDLISVQSWGKASPAAPQLAAFLAELACRKKSAPYVARGLVRNVAARKQSGLMVNEAAEERARISVAVDRLRQGKSDLVACPGAAGFAEKDWETLDAVMEYLDTHIAEPKLHPK